MLGPGSPNGLLEMAMQGQAQPDMQPAISLWAGGGAGPGGGSSPSFAPPPELAGYFGANGNPKIDDPRAVASQGGISLGQLANSLLPHGQVGQYAYDLPSDQGGFFSIQDLFGLSGRPGLTQVTGPQQPGRNMQVTREGAVGVPQLMNSGQEQPSTNNWRLLDQGPGWIMRNGYLINTKDPTVASGFGIGANMGGASGENWPWSFPRRTAIGTGSTFGFPNFETQGRTMGWPGGVGWVNTIPPNT
jgi:hypothetical protein